MKFRAINNTVVCRPHYEVQNRLSRFASSGEIIQTKEFGEVKVGRTVEYRNSTGLNKMAFGEVVSVGPGAAWMRSLKLSVPINQQIQTNDIIGFDASQFQNWKNDGRDLMILPTDSVLCRFNESDEFPVPIGVYFASVPDEGAARRFTFGKASQERGFILTNDQNKGEIRISDNPHSKVKFSVERIVAVGKGGASVGEGGQQAIGECRAFSTVKVDGSIKSIRTKEPIVVIPEADAVGCLAVFNNTMTTNVYCNGIRYSFTNWDRIKKLAWE